MSRKFTTGDGATATLVSTKQNDFALACWLMMDTYPAAGSSKILYNGNSGANGWGFFVTTTTVGGLFGGVAVLAGASPATGVWVHCCLSRTSAGGNIVTVYINGASVGTSGATPGVPGTSTLISTDNLKGKIAHAAIWESPLSAIQVLALARGVPPNRVGVQPKAYWPLLGLTSPEIDQIIGNVRPFTLSGAPTVFADAPMQPYAKVDVGMDLPSIIAENVTPPVVLGDAVVNATVTTTDGTWLNSPISYTYAWEVSDNGISGWTTIPGETANTLVIPIAYGGKYVRSSVIAVTVGGPSAPEPSSNSIGPIEPYPTVTRFSMIG